MKTKKTKTPFSPFQPHFNVFWKTKQKKKKPKIRLAVAWSEPYLHCQYLGTISARAAGYLRQCLLPGNRTTGSVMGTWRKRTDLPPAEEPCSHSSVSSTCTSQRPRHRAHCKRHIIRLHLLSSMVMPRSHTHTCAGTRAVLMSTSASREVTRHPVCSRILRWFLSINRRKMTEGSHRK